MSGARRDSPGSPGAPPVRGSRLHSILGLLAKRTGFPWIRGSLTLGPARPLLDWVHKHILWVPEERDVEPLPGIVLRLPPGPLIPMHLAYLRGYEPEVTQALRRILRRGMSFVDVGAFVGYYTVLASRLVGPEGRVYAFEPDPTNFRYLLHNLAVNGCTNVRAEQVAISDEEGLTGLHRAHYPMQHHLASQRTVKEPQVVVRTVSLDFYFARLGRPEVDLIKVDVEGHEWHVLRGAREVIMRNERPPLIVELNTSALRRQGRSPFDLFEILRDLGYNKVRLLETGEVIALRGGDEPWASKRVKAVISQGGQVKNLLVTGPGLSCDEAAG